MFSSTAKSGDFFIQSLTLRWTRRRVRYKGSSANLRKRESEPKHNADNYAVSRRVCRCRSKRRCYRPH
ncbi:hypothetical protein K523DRAFT_121749 [Schizophyllum commune Tattone D]|nr:hypothetical protein K523DRAFT_121749 [Schizophyllum commune Tattone D]